jgi:hypothetical protein
MKKRGEKYLQMNEIISHLREHRPGEPAAMNFSQGFCFENSFPVWNRQEIHVNLIEKNVRHSLDTNEPTMKTQ